MTQPTGNMGNPPPAYALQDQKKASYIEKVDALESKFEQISKSIKNARAQLDKNKEKLGNSLVELTAIEKSLSEIHEESEENDNQIQKTQTEYKKIAGTAFSECGSRAHL